MYMYKIHVMYKNKTKTDFVYKKAHQKVEQWVFRKLETNLRNSKEKAKKKSIFIGLICHELKACIKS